MQHLIHLKLNIHTITEFYDELKNDEMSLLYSGDFSDAVTSQVIGLSGVQFDDGSELNKIQKKTGFLIAECFQNIVRHNESSIENGFFLTRNDEGKLHIASGNIVLNEMIDNLSDRLDHLNTLSKEELKQIYIETLRDKSMSEKGGAGLGLIEMARKTGNSLDYAFQEVKENLSYFYFQMMFDTMLIPDGVAAQDLSLNKTIELRKSMLDNHLFMVYKGDISMNTVMPILNMVEQSMQSQQDDQQKNKKFYISLMEFLQNMSKHGISRDNRQHGLILLGEHNGNYLVGGRNYVDDVDKEILEKKYGAYSSLSLEELNEEYKRILKHGDPDNQKGSSLGILEMLRRSSAPVQYEIEENGEGSMFNVLMEI